MDGENKGQEAQVSGYDPALFDIVKDEQGNIIITAKPAADGANGVDVVIGPGNYGPGSPAAEVPAASTRPLPSLGHVLCQVCKRPTNSEFQKDLVDTPFMITFNGQPRLIICYECYTHSILHGAFASLPPDQRATNMVGGEGGVLSAEAENLPVMDSAGAELPRGSANG